MCVLESTRSHKETRMHRRLNKQVKSDEVQWFSKKVITSLLKQIFWIFYLWKFLLEEVFFKKLNGRGVKKNPLRIVKDNKKQTKLGTMWMNTRIDEWLNE